MNRRKPGHAFTPMTLGSMRELGVRSLAVTCEPCHHEAVLPAESWGDAVLPYAESWASTAKLAGNEGKRELEHAPNGLTNSKQFKGDSGSLGGGASRRRAGRWRSGWRNRLRRCPLTDQLNERDGARLLIAASYSS